MDYLFIQLAVVKSCILCTLYLPKDLVHPCSLSLSNIVVSAFASTLFSLVVCLSKNLLSLRVRWFPGTLCLGATISPLLFSFGEHFPISQYGTLHFHPPRLRFLPSFRSRSLSSDPNSLRRIRDFENPLTPESKVLC